MGIITRRLARGRQLGLLDWSMIKLLLILIGVIIGAYISDFVKTYSWHLVALAIILWIAMEYRLSKKTDNTLKKN